MLRFHNDIARSRRLGRLALGGASVFGLLIAFTLVQGLWIAVRSDRRELVIGAGFGLFVLLLAGAFVARLAIRQKRLLDEAESELTSLAQNWKREFLGEESDG